MAVESADMDHAGQVDLATADGHDRYVPSCAHDLVSAGHEGVYEWAVAHLVREGARFVDFGCGTGYGAARVVAAGGSFDGVDSSHAAIDFANAHYAVPNARFFVADLADRPPAALAPRSYDVVFSSEVLEHVVDPFAFVGMMADFMRDDGTCFIGTPNRLWSQGHMPRGQLMAASHVMEFTPQALAALLGTTFDDVRLHFRRLPDGADLGASATTSRSRLLRAAFSFAHELAPKGSVRFRHALSRRKGERSWSPADISWLNPEDPGLDVAQCAGLAAVCRKPRR